MTDLAASFPSLDFDRPEDGILVITMRAEGRLNAADAAMHRDLAEVWRAVDADSGTRAVIIRGAGGTFSSGGDFDLIEEIARGRQSGPQGPQGAREPMTATVGRALWQDQLSDAERAHLDRGRPDDLDGSDQMPPAPRIEDPDLVLVVIG